MIRLHLLKTPEHEKRSISRAVVIFCVLFFGTVGGIYSFSFFSENLIFEIKEYLLNDSKIVEPSDQGDIAGEEENYIIQDNNNVDGSLSPIESDSVDKNTNTFTVSSDIGLFEDRESFNEAVSDEDSIVFPPIEERNIDHLNIQMMDVKNERPLEHSDNLKGFERYGACFSLYRVVEAVSPYIRLSLVSCKSYGRYDLSGEISTDAELHDFTDVLDVYFEDYELEHVIDPQNSKVKIAASGMFKNKLNEPVNAIDYENALQIFSDIKRFIDENGFGDITYINADFSNGSISPTRWKFQVKAIGSITQINLLLKILESLKTEVEVVELILSNLIRGDNMNSDIRIIISVEMLVNIPGKF